MLYVLSLNVASAAEPYELLVPLPGIGEKLEGGLTQYIGWLFNFALTAAAFLAVLMIVIGGIQIVVGGASESARKNGKDRIWAAIWGLLLAICAWLILYTINPDMVKGTLDLAPAIVKAPAPSAGPPGPPPPPISWPPPIQANQYKDSDARTALAMSGISINKADCTYVGQTNCTSLDGIPKSTIQSLANLKNEAGESFQITGGTEYWLHSTHGPGKPIVDIKFDPSLIDNIETWFVSGKIAGFQCERLGIKVPCNSDSGPDHFHVRFNN